MFDLHTMKYCNVISISNNYYFKNRIKIKVPNIKQLTIPTRSPFPYSATNSFFPFSYVITERNRPLNIINVLSDSSPCLNTINDNFIML